MVNINKHKILITGGSGYIGARLSAQLARAGYAVTPLCYPTVPIDPTWVSLMDRIIVGDVRNNEFLQNLACSDHFDTIIHLVSLDHHQSTGDVSFVASVNITPTWSLLDIFSKQGLKKFIYFSTMQVYGKLPSEQITEQHKPQSQSAYALTHLIGEQLCEYYNHNSETECRVVRLSNSYGAPIFVENNCWWLVVNDLCRMAHKDGQIILQSDGTPVRDFIHGNDVCRAVEAIIRTDNPRMTYNVSSGNTLSILELANLVCKVYENRYNRPIKITTTPHNGNAATSER
ncbi:MAG: NAD-dependent epimerase/dehydratase family protein, partial [Mucinivorans sp.]